MTVLVVFDIEADPPMPIGRYVRTDEDTVIYTRPAGDHGYAPVDCVTVVAVDPITKQAAPDELQHRADGIYKGDRAEEINQGGTA